MSTSTHEKVTLIFETGISVMGRPLSADELADVSSEWYNPTVDTSKYFQSVYRAWEVDEEDYIRWKNAGGLCQEYAGKFYIA